jgi:hypothetical protein
MNDHLNISEQRRKEIEEIVDLLLPPEVAGSRESDQRFTSYCEKLPLEEKIFAIECGSNRGLKNARANTLDLPKA